MNFKNTISSDIGLIAWDSANYLNSIIVEYEFNKFPRAKVNLTLNNLDWIRYRYLDAKIDIDNFSTEFRLGIDNVVNLNKGQILFEGYLADPDAFTKIYSRYLGNNLESAIRTLGFSQNIEVDKIDNDFFQLNETSITSLNKLMLGSSFQGIYTISEKLIKAIPINSIDSNNNPKLLPRVPTGLQSDVQFSTNNLPERGSYKIASVSTDKEYELSMYSQYGVNLISPKNCQYDLNVVSNYIYQSGLSLMMNDAYDTIYDIEIGDIVTLPNKDLDENKFVVTKLVRYITPLQMRSSIEIQRQL